ncbi:MAG TPA: multicopper oxidase family protein [Pseudonocardiaceae bacterium]|jgi:spore coat protein A|nr:multicopper oxidase family protein [Pseudonocardiaceae bacterium]
MTGLSRRGFIGLVAGVGAAAGVGVPLLSGMAGNASTATLLSSGLPLPRPFTVPLTLPPVLRPTRSDASGDHYEITQRAASVEIIPGTRTTIWGYNGIFPGPTIESTSGRPAIVHHTNALPVPVVVHLHGGHTPEDSDGYPTDLILPANGIDPTMAGMPGMTTDPLARITTGERTYTFPLAQRGATLWYHDHRMAFTGASVWRGLAGFHIVRDPQENALPLPRGARELPLLIADRAFGADGSLRYPSKDPSLRMPGVDDPYSSGVLGDVILVNGRPWPVANVDRARYRLRLLNASNARSYQLTLDPAPPGGGGFTQIGSDGGLLAAPITHDAIEMAPAERFDVIVDFGRYAPGTEVVLANGFGSGSTAVVMKFRVGSNTEDASRIPDTLSTVTALDPAHATVTRDFHFGYAGDKSGWYINGQPYSPTNIAATPKLGTTEVWRLVSDFAHPIHLHLVHFQVLSRGLSGPGAYDHGWKDVVALRPAEEARIIARFDDYPGRFVFHCHNLEHEDMAMMGNFRVV